MDHWQKNVAERRRLEVQVEQMRAEAASAAQRNEAEIKRLRQQIEAMRTATPPNDSGLWQQIHDLKARIQDLKVRHEQELAQEYTQ